MVSLAVKFNILLYFLNRVNLFKNKSTFAEFGSQLNLFGHG